MQSAVLLCIGATTSLEYGISVLIFGGTPHGTHEIL